VPISSKAASPCQNNMCSLPHRPSPLKAGCFQSSLARSYSQQPVPATVHTSTAPLSKLLKSSLKCIGINKFVEIDVFLLPILIALGFNNQEKGVLARKSDDL